jgi:hypothetical protein
MGCEANILVYTLPFILLLRVENFQLEKFWNFSGISPIDIVLLRLFGKISGNILEINRKLKISVKISNTNWH